MIRINLLPTKKRSAARAATPPANMGQFWVVGWLITWGALVAAGWWFLGLKEDETQALRKKAAQLTTEAEAIKEQIDEEGLEAKKQELLQLEAAIEKLGKKKRTPVFVLYDIATLLTDPTMDPSDPPQLDLDEVKLRQLLREDPKAGINLKWDPSGLWLHSVEEKNGVLTLQGSARAASDLSEFVRRLRASGRFGTVTSPNFDRDSKSKDEAELRKLDWTIGGVSVRRWN